MEDLGDGGNIDCGVVHVFVTLFNVCLHHGVLTEIRRITDAIGSSWKQLAYRLGFQQADIEAIECACPRDPKSQACTLLDAWRQREGGKATLDELHRALKAANLRIGHTEHTVRWNGKVLLLLHLMMESIFVSC